MTDTPFLALLEELTVEAPTYLWTPIAFLYAQHRALIEFHRDYLEKRQKEDSQELLFESVFVKNKYVLNYISFVSSLNQLARALEKVDGELRILKQSRVRFFRNVVVEHWDEYVLPCQGQ